MKLNDIENKIGGIVPTGAKSFANEFKTFISRGNVIDMAVGVIIGTAFTAIVTSLVQDVLTPPLGLITGGLDFSDKFISLNGADYATLKAAQEASAPVIAYGLFLNNIIKFLIVSAVIFMLVRQINKLKAEAPPIEPAQPPRSEILLEEIRDLLKQKV